MVLPELPLQATQYRPDRSFDPTDVDITEMDHHLIDSCFDLAEIALMDGNPPVGAYIYSSRLGKSWGAKTVDKTVRRLMGHGELRAYDGVADLLGDDLSDCTLYTTAEPCVTCTAPYAEGKIGRIIFSAPRSDIYAVSGLMRPRKINMHEILVDGHTDTIVTSGLGSERALGLFATWGELQRQGKVKI